MTHEAAALLADGGEWSSRLGLSTWNFAVDFVNTAACAACHSGDGLATSEEFVLWNRAHPGLPEIALSGPVLSQLRSLRDDLRDLLERQALGKPPGSAALTRFNQRLRNVSTHLRARYSDGEWRFEGVPEAVSPAEQWLWEMTCAGADLLAGPFATTLRRCQAPRCGHFLVSRMQGQLWCSPTGCGNRVRVARHRKRSDLRAY